MSAAARPVVAGIDLGGTAVNYTFVDRDERWLIDGLCEHPARSKEGPDICLQQIADGLDMAVAKAGIALEHVVVVGLDTPGPASSTGVLSARGSTNFVHPAWAGFDLREALAHKLGKPVTYLNDGNAGALWGHFTIFGAQRTATSISAIVGTGLGGGVIVDGNVVKGRQRLRRRARPRADSLPEHQRHRGPRARVQLRANGRSRVALLADRDWAIAPAVFPDPLPEP